MSFIKKFDLNLSPISDQLSSEEEANLSNRSQLLDPNKDLEDVSCEENLHQLQTISTRNIDLNEPLLDNTSEQDELQNEQDLLLGEHAVLQGRPVPRKLKVLSNEERRQIYLVLLHKSVSRKLRKGTIRAISKMFFVSTRTVSRIWRQAKSSPNPGLADVSHRKTKNCGRKRIEIDSEQFRKIPLSRRTSLESLACAINVSRATLHRNVRSGRIRRHTNPVKPQLKDSNKKAKVQFCLSMIDRNSLLHNPKFSNMYNMIHIDEKWFFISRKTERYYLLPDECDPERTCKSKFFLTKVMFLAAIARPRFDSDGNEIFSGKIGIFPYVTQEAAKRSSSNRVAGTLETKAITSIGRDMSRFFLINKVIPAIAEKWPFSDANTLIYIQQDNARTHINPNDEEFRIAVARSGLNIQLTYQPPNSPDLNVLDLGFFNAIQTLHYKEAPRNIDDLTKSVEKAFYTFPTNKSNRIFLTLQECIIEIMKVRGANTYKIPHIKKASLERKKELPIQMQCDAELIEDARKWLNFPENV